MAKTSKKGHTASLEELIESKPTVMMGKPVVKGTRITVELILEKLAAGESVEQPAREAAAPFLRSLATLSEIEGSLRSR